MLITIVNYNVGNIQSIVNMLKKIGHSAIVTSNIEDIKNAQKLILPGVGSFDYGMEQLENSKLIEVLNNKVLKNKTPILGICLGAQLFLQTSEEGVKRGLDWFDAKAVKFKFSDNVLKIPHMGWNNIRIKKKNRLLEGLNDDSRFYFVHSYHFEFADTTDILTTTDYGYSFISSFSRDNIYGVQFHPEKSHKFGMALLKNFAEL